MVPTAPPAPQGQQLRPERTAAGRWSTRLRTAPPVWRELLLIVLFYSAYTLTRLVLNGGGTSVAFANADEILALERALGIDVELGLNRALLEVSWLALAANYFYGTAHFAVTLAIVVWLYRYRPQHYRWLRTALMVATAVALIGFWLYPLAPPRFLTVEGFVDPVQALGSWGLYSGQSAGTLTNQYAAMPSMHAGWALWCGYVLVRLGAQRRVKAVGVLYPVVTVLVILATANHYIVDAVVGVALVGGALMLSRAVYLRGPAVLGRLSRTGSAARPAPPVRPMRRRPAAPAGRPAAPLATGAVTTGAVSIGAMTAGAVSTVPVFLPMTTGVLGIGVVSLGALAAGAMTAGASVSAGGASPADDEAAPAPPATAHAAATPSVPSLRSLVGSGDSPVIDDAPVTSV